MEVLVSLLGFVTVPVSCTYIYVYGTCIHVRVCTYVVVRVTIRRDVVGVTIRDITRVRVATCTCVCSERACVCTEVSRVWCTGCVYVRDAMWRRAIGRRRVPTSFERESSLTQTGMQILPYCIHSMAVHKWFAHWFAGCVTLVSGNAPALLPLHLPQFVDVGASSAICHSMARGDCERLWFSRVGWPAPSALRLDVCGRGGCVLCRARASSGPSVCAARGRL